MIELNKIKKEDIFYEDDLVIGALNPEPIHESHVIVFPKKKYEIIETIDNETFLRMNTIATFCSTIIFEASKLEGTNIIFYGGKNSNNKFDRANIQIIGRKLKDNLDLFWNPKPAKNLNEIEKQIKEETFYIGKKKSEKKEENNIESNKKEIKETDEENYIFKHLIRIP